MDRVRAMRITPSILNADFANLAAEIGESRITADVVKGV